MANWNSAHWNTPILWGPALPPSSQNKTKATKSNTMKRQAYFPILIAEQPEWFNNFAKINGYAAALDHDPFVVAERVKDTKFCGYVVGDWLTAVRTHGTAATAGIEVLFTGTGVDPYVLPGFTAPVLPVGVVPVPPGALDRIFAYVQIIKNSAGYTEAIGQDLRIIGSAAPPSPDVPTFDLVLEMGTGCHCVRVRFRKYGHMGVYIVSRRNAGVEEVLGIDTASPYLDERPLLVAGAPEIREFRMRFWDDGAPVGDWTPWQKVTVSPS